MSSLAPSGWRRLGAYGTAFAKRSARRKSSISTASCILRRWRVSRGPRSPSDRASSSACSQGRLRVRFSSPLKNFCFRTALMSRFYITTAIPYANGAPHIGHAYERIATDAIQRFMRLDGRETLFVTGMDEHGLKVQQAAAREGVTPQQFVDRVAAEFEAMGEMLNARADDIVRTTQAAPRARLAGDLGADGRQRRHLSVEIFGLVFGARRGLFRRQRADRWPGRDEARAERRAGRMGRGGELLLPALPIRRQAVRALRRPSRIRHARNLSQRDRRLREARALRSLDQPRDPQMGRAGSRRPEARDVCLGRRADQLHHRDRLPGRWPAGEILAGGRRMSSARTSRASTPSTGRPS